MTSTELSELKKIFRVIKGESVYRLTCIEVVDLSKLSPWFFE